jgi:hypothetical protein
MTHRYGLFLAVAQVACYGIYRRWKAAIVPLLSVSAIAVGTAYLFLSGRIRSGNAGRPTGGRDILSLLAGLTAGTPGLRNVEVMPFPQLLAFPSEPANIALLIASGVVFGLLLLAGRRSVPELAPTQRQGLVVLATCVTIPIVLDAIAGSSLSPAPRWLLRGILYIWPLFYMIVVILSRHAAWRGPLLATALVLSCLALSPYFTRYSRFDETPALTSLADQVKDDDLIVVDPSYMHPVVRYHVRNHPQLIGYHEDLGWLDVELLHQIGTFVNTSMVDPPPAPRGRIFVYPRKGGVSWLSDVTGVTVLEYDMRSHTWVPLVQD